MSGADFFSTSGAEPLAVSLRIEGQHMVWVKEERVMF